MDDLMIALLDALFWLFVLDFDNKKGQAWAKLTLWLFVAVVLIGVVIVVP